MVRDKHAPYAAGGPNPLQIPPSQAMDNHH